MSKKEKDRPIAELLSELTESVLLFRNTCAHLGIDVSDFTHEELIASCFVLGKWVDRYNLKALFEDKKPYQTPLTVLTYFLPHIREHGPRRFFAALQQNLDKKETSHAPEVPA